MQCACATVIVPTNEWECNNWKNTITQHNTILKKSNILEKMPVSEYILLEPECLLTILFVSSCACLKTKPEFTSEYLLRFVNVVLNDLM